MKNLEETKQCTICLENKFFTEFYADGHRRDGVRAWCKDCTKKKDKEYRQAHPEVSREKMRRWRKNNPQKTKISNLKNGLKRTANISIKQYENLLQEQNYKCAICGKKDRHNKRLSVDHCHQTQKVRGLLCTDCNLILGNCHDNIDILDDAKKYLIYM